MMVINIVSEIDETVRYLCAQYQPKAALNLVRISAGFYDANDARLGSKMLALGRKLLEKDQYDSAEIFLRYGLELNPDDPDLMAQLHSALGYALNRQGDFAEAELHLLEFRLFDDSSYKGFANLCHSLCGQKRFPEAARLYLEAMRVAPADEYVFKFLSDLLMWYPELLEYKPDLGEKLKETVHRLTAEIPKQKKE
jgi:Flp pilus assembly protein TadD